MAVRTLSDEVNSSDESVSSFQQLSDDIDQLRSSATILLRDMADSASCLGDLESRSHT